MRFSAREATSRLHKIFYQEITIWHLDSTKISIKNSAAISSSAWHGQKRAGDFFIRWIRMTRARGHINSVSVLPQGHPERDHTGRSVTVFDNVLNIEVRGEYS